jgi:hypothetical protein
MSSSLTILYDDHTIVSCLLLESRALSCKAVRALKEQALKPHFSRCGVQAHRPGAGIRDPREKRGLNVWRAYLQHELNLTLQKFAETGANTIVVPANMRGFEMILPTDKLAQQ